LGGRIWETATPDKVGEKGGDKGLVGKGVPQGILPVNP
jgi:hypothetical protein